MNGSVYIAKIFGIDIRLHYTWFIVFFLLTFLLVEPDYQKISAWLIGICTSLLFFTSVLAHELAHSLIGKANGIPVSSITLFIFGGMAVMEKDANKPGSEFKMALAGPVCSLTLGVIFGVVLLIPGVTGPVAGMFFWLAIMNGIMAVFNLIPGFPLDGGRVIRSLIWKSTGNYFTASRIATLIGQLFGTLFMIAGLFIILLRPFGMSWGDGLWTGAIGWFLSSAAVSNYRLLIREHQISSQTAYKEITGVDYKVMNHDGDAKN